MVPKDESSLAGLIMHEEAVWKNFEIISDKESKRKHS